ncbi:MAG: hypothetical protein J7599_06975 [Niabella sp.]|nr:hypothetical protein [Niabella sp.]
MSRYRYLFSVMALICSLYAQSQCNINITTGEFNGTFGTTTVPRNLQVPPGTGYVFETPRNTQAGGYAVISKSYFPNWHSYPGIWSYAGHTTGANDDAYLAVNGSSVIGTFYRETVSLTGNTGYTFGVWHASALAGITYGLEIQVYEGTPGPGSIPIARAQTGIVGLAVWTPLFLNFTTGAAGNYTIQLLNSSTVIAGNDFSIDDISLVANAACKPVAYPVIKDVTGAPASVSLGDKPLQGNESGGTQQNWVGSATITSLPTNGFVLTYNGYVITQADIDGGGYVIANYDPSKLSIAPGPGTPGGAKTTSFSYAVNGTNTRSDDATYTVNFSSALPVVFGAIAAYLHNDGLVINWTTETETNNDHFEIEASVNGIDFTTVGFVTSQAPGGNSKEAIQYRFSKDVASDMAALGLGMLVLGSLGSCFCSRRYVLRVWALLLAGAAFYMAGCEKTETGIAGNGKLYVRVVQVDKDGTRVFSKVVTVVKE